MEEEIDDRKLGYVLIFVTIALLIGAAYGFWHVYFTPYEVRAVRFSHVGALAIEDPVHLEGMVVGEIERFEHDDNGNVIAYIKSPKPIPLRTSSRIMVKAKGVMGERYVEIKSGNPNDPLVPADVIFDGIFEMGPPEAIAHMDLLDEKIIELVGIMRWLRDGKDDGKRPFIVAFEDVINTVDTLVTNMTAFFVDNETNISAGLDTAARLVDATLKLTTDIGRVAPEFIDDLSRLITTVDNAATKIEELIVRLDPIVEKIDGNKYLWGEHVEQLETQLKTIRRILDDIRERGLPLPVKFKFF